MVIPCHSARICSGQFCSHTAFIGWWFDLVSRSVRFRPAGKDISFPYPYINIIGFFLRFYKNNRSNFYRTVGGRMFLLLSLSLCKYYTLLLRPWPQKSLRNWRIFTVTAKCAENAHWGRRDPELGGNYEKSPGFPGLIRHGGYQASMSS